MPKNLVLVSFHLCPYVQRAAIALAEKGVAFDRAWVDLADKPDWFNRISPLGKVPLLRVDDVVLFESNVILEYLEETQPGRLHPTDPIERAKHRAWIEFGSAILDNIWRFYAAPDAETFERHRVDLAGKFARVEDALGDGPWFAGDRFTLVDAVYGPIFRYFDTFDTIGEFGVLRGNEKVIRWREQLAARPSIRNAVTADYPERLAEFLRNRHSHLSSLMSATMAA